MRLPCTVDIEQLDKDIDKYTEITSRMQLAYLKDGRSTTGAAYRELARQRNLVDDRMSAALDNLIYQIEHGAIAETVQDALRMAPEWRQSINVHKSPRRNPRGWQWGGYIGHVERAAYYGLRAEPETYHEWYDKVSWVNLPRQARAYIDSQRPERITDWESMRRLLPEHRRIIKDCKAVTSAYEHAVATVGRARVFGEEEEQETTAQVQQPQPVSTTPDSIETEEDVDEFMLLVLEWQNDPKWRKFHSHVWRWQRVLQALGNTNKLNHPTLGGEETWHPMTLREAEFKYNRFKNKRWMRVVQEFRERGVE